MRDLHAVINAAHYQAFFALVKLERLTQVELQRYKGLDLLARTGMPSRDEVRDTGISTDVVAGLDLRKQRASRASILFGPQRIGLERLLQLGNEPAQLAKPRRPAVGRNLYFFWHRSASGAPYCATSPCVW